MFLKNLVLILAVFSIKSYAADSSIQRPVSDFSLDECKGSYSQSDFEEMSKVKEDKSVRELFPASYLFSPTKPGLHPGVLILHGSEGGRFGESNMCQARYLASKGYAALSFCYFDCGNDQVPEQLFRVDLYRTYLALKWLKESTYVGGGKVAISGVSRGAEHAVILASLLASISPKEKLIIPDAVIAHAPYGKIVGAFNWKWKRDLKPRDLRWNAELVANSDCLSIDKLGNYAFQDGAKTKIQLSMSWKKDATNCNQKPALSPEDCWKESISGAYSSADGKKLEWQSQFCGIAPDPNSNIYTVPGWTWKGSLSEVAAKQDIPLQKYKGAIFVSQGTADKIWAINDGAKYLLKTLENSGAKVLQLSFDPAEEDLRQVPDLSNKKIVFSFFKHEGHIYSSNAAKAEWSLKLSFLKTALNQGDES